MNPHGLVLVEPAVGEDLVVAHVLPAAHLHPELGPAFVLELGHDRVRVHAGEVSQIRERVLGGRPASRRVSPIPGHRPGSRGGAGPVDPLDGLGQVAGQQAGLGDDEHRLGGPAERERGLARGILQVVGTGAERLLARRLLVRDPRIPVSGHGIGQEEIDLVDAVGAAVRTSQGGRGVGAAGGPEAERHVVVGGGGERLAGGRLGLGHQVHVHLALEVHPLVVE